MDPPNQDACCRSKHFGSVYTLLRDDNPNIFKLLIVL
jgi:hypothetical protein